MNNNTASLSLTSRVIKTEHVNWREFLFIQQSDFKTWNPQDKEKLKQSIIQNQFVQPFYVWQDPVDNAIYCLDGQHRTLAMYELIDQGYYPSEKLPATFIHCVDKQEAAKLVLIYSSMYAKVAEKGLYDFIQLYELNYDQLKIEVDLPEFSFERFEQKFNIFEVDNIEEETVEVNQADVIVSAGDVFEINGHRIGCGSYDEAILCHVVMNDNNAKLVFTDPPYNLSADFIVKDNSRKNKPTRHDDFAEAAGEMSDIEFVEFLHRIMVAAKVYTCEGSLHYYFMDWRHVWHMTEAAKDAYGSPVPKQMCVWNKDTMALGSFYRSKHELIFIFKNGDAKHTSHLELKDRIRSNVWDYPSANSSANKEKSILKDHPTPKPVQLVADAILDSTNKGDIVLDFFLGSGTTLIACEATERLCFATEIEPRHVQQSILRYINFCDKNGIQVKFNHENGSLTLNSFTDAISKKQSV